MRFRPVSEEESTIGTCTVSERPRGVTFFAQMNERPEGMTFFVQISHLVTFVANGG
jgi:hypothetical protein